MKTYFQKIMKDAKIATRLQIMYMKVFGKKTVIDDKHTKATIYRTRNMLYISEYAILTKKQAIELTR